MEFLEKDLENIIWESDNELLEEKGLFIEGRKIRQLRIGKYGISDIITIKRKYEYFYSYLEITVHEYKKDCIGISAFLQALNYCKGIATFLNNRNFYRFTLNIVLCGRTLDKSGSFCFIPDMLSISNYVNYGTVNSIRFYTYDYGLNGLKFKEECNYNLTDKGF